MPVHFSMRKIQLTFPVRPAWALWLPVVTTPKCGAAELLGVLTYDDEVRRDVIRGQRRRLQDFGDDRIVRDLQAIIDRVGRSRR